MNIGELFVTLGIKGADSVGASLGGVQKGLKGAAAAAKNASMAFGDILAGATKGALGIDRLSTLLGVSTDSLRVYQQAAMAAGVSTRDFEDSLKAIQTAMANTVQTGKRPEGMFDVERLTGKISDEDIKGFAKDPQKALDRLQDYAGKETDAGVRNRTLRSFGIGDETNVALAKKAFSFDKMKMAGHEIANAKKEYKGFSDQIEDSSEKAKKGTDKASGGLKNTASAAFATKAALVGAMYALERLFATSNQRGAGLTNFNAALGVSVQTLQQYQYAARQVGVSNDEVESSFKAIQSIMTRTLMGDPGAAPKGLARVAQLTGDLSPDDLKKFSENPQLLIQRLQEYSKKETDLGLRNEVLKSFGMSDGMIAALARNAFTPEVLNKAPTYSDKEVKSLDKNNAAWGNLGNKVQMAVGHFNAAHGGKLVADLSLLIDKVFMLGEAFIKLADKLELFKLFGKIFEGWALIFNAVSHGVDSFNETVDGATKDPEKAKALQDGFFKFFSTDTLEGLVDLGKSVIGAGEKPKPAPSKPATNPNAKKAKPPSAESASLRLVIPELPNGARPEAALPNTPTTASNSSNQTFNTNQTLNFQHEGKDAKKTADSVKEATNYAYRQSYAQGQVV